MKRIVLLLLCCSVFALSAFAFSACGQSSVPNDQEQGKTEIPVQDETKKPLEEKDVETFKIYTEAEINEDERKAFVEIVYYPAENATEGNRFAVVCPGGGLNKGNAAEGWFDEAIAFWSSLR